MIKRDLFVTLGKTKWLRVFSPIIMQQKELMRWHPSGVIGVNFSEILCKGKEI